LILEQGVITVSKPTLYAVIIFHKKLAYLYISTAQNLSGPTSVTAANTCCRQQPNTQQIGTAPSHTSTEFF